MLSQSPCIGQPTLVFRFAGRARLVETALRVAIADRTGSRH
jgi:hypothetical protein